MSKRSGSKHVLAAALACAFLLSLLAAGTAGAGEGGDRSKATASPGSVVLRELRASPREVRAYWTPRRMRRAQPLPLRAARPSGDLDPGAPAEPRGKPRRVPPAYPLSGSTAGGAASGAAVALRAGSEPRIHQPVSREEVTDTTLFPNRTHGKAFFTLPSEPPPNDFACSATVVNANNESLVLTAGHCVHGGGPGGSFATNWMFAPGYRNGSAPFGEWAATDLATLDGWSSSESFSFDVGTAVMQRDASGRGIQDVVGARGIAFNQPRDQSYRAFGYPALPPPLEFDGEKLYVCNSPYGGDDDAMSDPKPMRIACDMTEGSSGGGWVVSDAFVESVISYRVVFPPTELNHLFGPYFGTAAASLYDAAQGPPPQQVEGSPPGEPQEGEQPGEQPGQSEPAPTLRCRGKPVTHVGTAAADKLIGTRKSDVFLAGGGNDTIRGRGGRDYVCAGDGLDRVFGGRGGDVLAGGRGWDMLNGGRGRDKLRGGPGRDLCRGGRGRDRARTCERKRGI